MAGRWVPRRQAGQAVVETAIGLVLVLSLLALVLTAAGWGYTQSVVTTAVQDGARAASAQGGDVQGGYNVTQQLLRAGLGGGAGVIDVSLDQDDESVTVSADGSWPLAVGPGVNISLPVHAEARMLKDRWR
jgi:Flp pilus assembly protein TadG